MQQNGFTLIELVIVIAIIGILAAFAIPRFINIANDAQVAATTSIAGALSSANANNYAERKLNSSLGVAITNCDQVPNAMQTGIPAGYSIRAAAVATDVTVNCVLTGPGPTTATFTATGIS